MKQIRFAMVAVYFCDVCGSQLLGADGPLTAITWCMDRKVARTHEPRHFLPHLYDAASGRVICADCINRAPAPEQ